MEGEWAYNVSQTESTNELEADQSKDLLPAKTSSFVLNLPERTRLASTSGSVTEQSAA